MNPVLTLVASAALAAACNSAFAADSEKSRDAREVVMVDAQTRAVMLGEMRNLLSNTQVLLEALAKDDVRSAAKAARASGLKAASEADKRIMKQLPEDFRSLGMSLHQDFDRIADAAEQGADAKKVLAQLAVTMQKCNACHAGYQLRVGPRAASQK